MDENHLAAIDRAIAPLQPFPGQPPPPALLLLKYGAGKPLIVAVADPDDASHIALLITSPLASKRRFISWRRKPPNYRAGIEYAAELHAATTHRLDSPAVSVIVVQDLSPATANGELTALISGLEASNSNPQVRFTLIGQGAAGTATAAGAQEAGLGVRSFLPAAETHPDVAAVIAAG